VQGALPQGVTREKQSLLGPVPYRQGEFAINLIEAVDPTIRPSTQNELRVILGQSGTKP
jgi:hypothetical protein